MAIEFYRMLAYKTLTEEQFGLDRFPRDFEGTLEYWRALARDKNPNMFLQTRVPA